MRIQSKYLEEKLTAADPTSKWISDFVHSDNPKFAGKSKKERIRMALGASYAAKGQSRNEETAPPFTPDKNKTPIAKPGKAGYGPSAAKHLAKMALKNQQKKTPVDEASAEELLTVAKKVNPNATISTPESRAKKEKERQERAAKATPYYPKSTLPTYPLGGYDPKSNRSYSEEVELDEEQKYYSLVHKSTNKVLSTHKDLDSAKDEHRGMDQGVRALYRIATSTKEPKTYNMKEEAEIEEGIGGAIAGGIGQFIGNKIDPLHGEILRTHGEMAGRAAEYTIRKHLNRLHKALKSHLSSGNATNEAAEYNSLPASKALQKAHDEERKKRGLPDPDYYLKLAAQKKKEIEDMKKNEEVEQIDELKKSTLASYAKKASHDARIKMATGKDFERISRTSKKPAYKASAQDWENKYKSDARRREAGVNRAIDKLAKEEVEPIEELKKETLKSYADKSIKDAETRRKQGNAYEKLVPSDSDYAKSFYKKSAKRLVGASKAMSRLAKEEVEQVDELKKSTLGSYISKASVDMANRTAEGERKRTLAGADYAHNISRGMSVKTAEAGMKKDYAAAKPDVNKAVKRMRGIDKAVGRLAKEETELDEISQNTALNAYAKRAARAATTKDPKDREKADKAITRIGKRWEADAQRRAWNRADKLIYKEETELDEGKKKGLWDNIHAKRQRGERPARPGEKGYPKTLNIEGTELDEAGRMQGGGKDPCWKGYKMIGTKNKAGREVPNCVPVKEEKTFKSLREKLNGNE